MLRIGVPLMCFCISLAVGFGPGLDPEVRARLEARAVSSMSLRDLEAMVEKDDTPESRFVVIPKRGGPVAEAFVVHRKPKSGQQNNRFAEPEVGAEAQRRYEPEFNSGFQPFFSVSDLEYAHSSPVQRFYDSIVDSVMSGRTYGVAADPFAVLDMAASEDTPRYTPRFDYDAYAEDSTETKLRGKPYWKDAPERSDETIDENGCRTVVKRIVDPDDEKSRGKESPKTVVITKECESPTLNGPDAKIAEAPPLRYDSTRPKELDFDETESRDPLKSDYIDSMLDKHFKSFPGFSNPLSSFRGYQQRFKLLPDSLKNVKPTVGFQTYEHSHPKSGFDEDSPSHAPSGEHNHGARTEGNSKDPEMKKKSFAYYRKDNPKNNPDDHQYAEEYAHGNYRSFSSSYDSEKDGPKKQ